jgi:prefoldin subunit 4
VEEEIAQLKEELNKVNDAADEIIISDDVIFHVGDVYVDVDTDTCEQMLEVERKRVNKQLKSLESEHVLLSSKMKELKAQLYAKFGRNINLEPK